MSTDAFDPGAGPEPEGPGVQSRGGDDHTHVFDTGGAEASWGAVSPDLSRLSDEDRAALADLPAGSSLLTIRRGEVAGSRILLDAPRVTAGRSPDCDIFLDDVTVSRHHAVFERDRTGYRLLDGGSLNGTYHNDTRIESDVLLSSGDRVQIGKYRMRYYASPSGQG